MIVVIDIESTGTDRQKDQILEICIQSGLAGDPQVWRIKPAAPIPQGATDVHGISDADVADCPAFAEVAPQIVSLLAGAGVVIGYNVSFDIDMLQAELARAGMQPLDLSAKHVVDVLRLWHHVEPRTLAAAHEKFIGAPLVNAHSAGADVAATARVLDAMLTRFGFADRTWSNLAAISNPFEGRENWIGPSHHVQWDGERAVFSFGKHKGCHVDEVETGFLQWVIDKDFPRHVKHICRAALKFKGNTLTAWIAANYPRPVQLKEIA